MSFWESITEFGTDAWETVSTGASNALNNAVDAWAAPAPTPQPTSTAPAPQPTPQPQPQPTATTAPVEAAPRPTVAFGLTATELGVGTAAIIGLVLLVSK